MLFACAADRVRLFCFPPTHTGDYSSCSCKHPHFGQIDETDHTICVDHLDLGLLSWDAVQDQYRSNPGNMPGIMHRVRILPGSISYFLIDYTDGESICSQIFEIIYVEVDWYVRWSVRSKQLSMSSPSESNVQRYVVASRDTAFIDANALLYHQTCRETVYK